MKAALQILKKDLLAILKNPIALIVLWGLLVLSGLYSWYCVIASWNPYSNTGNIPVGVVCEDEGAKNDLIGEINIGQTVIEQLKENKSIKWEIYDSKEQALEDTKYGFNYATIVFPKSLSEDILGIFEGSPRQAHLNYYPNDKYSAVASKVTETAASQLVTQINQNFSSKVNGGVLNAGQSLADTLKKHAADTKESALRQAQHLSDDIDKIISSLDDSLESLEGWQAAAAGAKDAVTSTGDQLPYIRELLDTGSSDLNSIRTRTTKFSNAMSSSILASSADIASQSAQLTSAFTKAKNSLITVEGKLTSIIKAAQNDPALRLVVNAMKSTNQLLKNIIGRIDEHLITINSKVKGATTSVKVNLTRVSESVTPLMDTGLFELSSSLSHLSGTVGQFEPQIDQMISIIDDADATLQETSDVIIDAQNLLLDVRENLTRTIEDMGAIGNALQLEGTKDILNIDPEKLNDFMTTPVSLVTEKIYAVSNYGTAVAPFYTNLALWVGCFVLVSILKVEINNSQFKDRTPRQKYFGRWFLFMILALIQSQIICGVDILLGIDCQNPVLFMAAGAVCSFVYMNIIFAFVKMFRNVGKTLCIILLIMQVPGSSGMFPIQLMPEFLQNIHGFLPFTYGIGAMREALCGMNGYEYFKDLATLLLNVPLSLFIGLFLSRLLNNLLLLFDKEMNKTGFFAGETYHKGGESQRVRRIIRTLASSDSYKDSIEAQALSIKKKYPRLRKMGSIALFLVPLLLLLVYFILNNLFELQQDAKLLGVSLMIITLLLIIFFMIVLEYTYRSIKEEVKALGDELLEDIKTDPNYKTLADSYTSHKESKEAARMERSVLRSMKKGHAIKEKPRHGVIRDIFRKDLKLGFQSVVGAIVIILLVITPSLYAWYNLAANWDPYSASSNLKVAIANEDKGYKTDLIPFTINMGSSLVIELHGNKSMDWMFVSKDEAIEGVKSGEFYAAIEIPSSFSKNMMTYLIHDEEHPDVIYYTNEKMNPIAPLMTQKGAASIQDNIRIEFTKMIDQVVFAVGHDTLNFFEQPKIQEYADTMTENLDNALNDAHNASQILHSLSRIANMASRVSSTTGTTIDGVEASAQSAKDALKEVKKGASHAAGALSNGLSITENAFNAQQLDAAKIKKIADSIVGLLQIGSDTVPHLIDANIAELESLKTREKGRIPESKFNEAINALKQAKADSLAISDQITNAKTLSDRLIDDTKSTISESKAFLKNEIIPTTVNLKTTLSDLSAITSDIFAGIGESFEGVSSSTGSITRQLDELSGELGNTGERIEAGIDRIEVLKKKLEKALNSKRFAEVKEIILGNDPEYLAERLVVPLEVNEEPVFSVANYGSAMAPFFTVFSLWVGALVIVSTIHLRLSKKRTAELKYKYSKVKPFQEYLGRYGLFGLIGLMQSILVLCGDLFLLNIQCNNPIAFILFGIFIGQVFCLLVYTLSELFGNIGKSICIILLIMQVAASGRTFPVEMLDPTLGHIAVFLPFYHAITILQECVAGILWIPVAVSTLVLISIILIALILAIPLRKPLRKSNDFFEAQLEKTGFM